ncbi:MAG: ATP-binding cassette domain-containing protein [Nitrososphaeria archaeon]
MPLIEAKNVSKHYYKRKGFFGKKELIKAVDNVSFSIEKGTTLGLVGETGCGKTTLAKCLLRLINPTSGAILFKGKDLSKMKSEELDDYHRSVQIVFQNPFTSLNPRMTIRNIISEPIITHKKINKTELETELVRLLKVVGLNETHLSRYPHELSGGQNQRVAIARAIALNPELIILDEPTSALDVSVQATILNLLNELQKQFNLSYIFISHDLGVVRFISDYIIVMYSGKFVEMGPSEDILGQPLHPYTKMLLLALPLPDPKKKIELIQHQMKALEDWRGGCVFLQKCPYGMELCKKEEPEMVEVREKHFVACYYTIKGDRR